MVFGNCGVLMEISPDKGYVEMTGIDAETSQDIAEAINAKGGRYLEAQVQGSKTHAQEGTLVILAAGDRSLFDDCTSCFDAMGKNSFYFGEVGNASKMNLVLQLMAGVTLAGLAESMALADRAGLQQKDVLEVLELTSLACPAIVDKGRGSSFISVDSNNEQKKILQRRSYRCFYFHSNYRGWFPNAIASPAHAERPPTVARHERSA